MRAALFSCLLLLGLIPAGVLASDAEHLVIIKKFAFLPATITIKRGATIRWENHEKRQYHSVWFESSGEEEPDEYFFPDESFERQFNQTGSFSYRCGPHEEMKGLVIVVE